MGLGGNYNVVCVAFGGDHACAESITIAQNGLGMRTTDRLERKCMWHNDAMTPVLYIETMNLICQRDSVIYYI